VQATKRAILQADLNVTVVFICTSRLVAVEVLHGMCEERTVASADAETCRFELTIPPFRLNACTS
jgi:hypothetical protein